MSNLLTNSSFPCECVQDSVRFSFASKGATM